jgi:tetratricopeptide (TPR) repeat protein
VIPRASKKLAIFFSGTGVGDNVFHWLNMGQRIEANVILVNTGRNEWYMKGIPGLGDSYGATVEAFRNWANALGATAGDLAGAVAIHKGILAQWPSFGLSHYGLGRIYAGKKSLRAAIKCLERAVEHDPYRATFRSKLEETRALANAAKA